MRNLYIGGSVASTPFAPHLGEAKQLKGPEGCGRMLSAGEGRVVALLVARRGGRKVRAPQGRVVGNADRG